MLDIDRGKVVAVAAAGRISADDAGCCLHELFEHQADLRSEAPALICGELTLSYRELELRANRLAHHLRGLGAGPGTLIGVAFERSELPIIAILACLKAGAAYVPIDPSHPDERIRYIAQEACMNIVITECALSGRLCRIVAARIIAINDGAQIQEAKTSRISRAESGVSPRDLCYVIYTSGTTGRPKGVMTEHRNAVHFVQAFNAVCTTTAADRVYQGFALGFDGSVEEIWMAFSNGATLVVGNKDTPRFGNELE